MAIRDDGRRKPSAGGDDFEVNQGFVHFVLALVFAICGIASGYATFTGIRLFLSESGTSGLLVGGTSIILTIAVSAILIVGWSLLVRYGSEIRGFRLTSLMGLLGAWLFAITLCVSSLSNLMAIVGPNAKIEEWSRTQNEWTTFINDLADRSGGAAQQLPFWEAQNAQACALALGESEGGLASGLGGGVGPVANVDVI